MSRKNTSVPESYREQKSCADCRFCLRYYEYDEGNTFYCCYDRSQRPSAQSVAMGEVSLLAKEYKLLRAEDYRFNDMHNVDYEEEWYNQLSDGWSYNQRRIWENWAEKHLVLQEGICDHWRRLSFNDLDVFHIFVFYDTAIWFISYEEINNNLYLTVDIEGDNPEDSYYLLRRFSLEYLKGFAEKNILMRDFFNTWILKAQFNPKSDLIELKEVYIEEEESKELFGDIRFKNICKDSNISAIQKLEEVTKKFYEKYPRYKK